MNLTQHILSRVSEPFIPLLPPMLGDDTCGIFDASGHFFTKVLVSALISRVLENISRNSGPNETKVVVAWYSFHALKDFALMCGTVQNQCHTIPEILAGALTGVAGLAGARVLFPEGERESLAIKSRSSNPSHFRITYGKEAAILDLDSRMILEGTLPAKIQKIALKWAARYQKELLEQPELSLVLK